MTKIPVWLEYLGTIGFPLVTMVVLLIQGLKFSKGYLTALKPHVREDPPYSYPPAVLGCLWKFGTVGLNDLVGTVLDLARRGSFLITEKRESESQFFGKEVKYDYYFHPQKKKDNLAAYELFIYDFFRDLEARGDNNLSYIKKQLETDVGWFISFFSSWSRQVRKGSKAYRRLGQFESQLIAVTYTFGGGLVLLSLVTLAIGLSSWWIPLIVGIGEGLWSYHSSTKNAMGSEEFLEWSAYRRYLSTLAEDGAQVNLPESWEDAFLYGIELGVYSAVLEGWRKSIPKTEKVSGDILVASDGEGMNYLSGVGNLTNTFSKLTSGGEKVLELFTVGKLWP